MSSWEVVWYCPCCDGYDGEIAESKKEADEWKRQREAKGQKVEMFETDQTGNRIDPKSYGFWLDGKYTPAPKN